MENASKALVIAGAILICIMIVAVGMYVYKNSGASIEDSMSSISTQEIETFNAKYTMYEGEQTGSNVKSLVGILISNAKTNVDENARIPGIYLENNDNAKKSFNSGIPENGENSAYIDALQGIRQQIDSKHKYWVEVNYQSNGLIDYINISYDKNAIIEPMKRN